MVNASSSGWHFACPDWRDRLKNGTSMVPVLPLDERLAAQAAAIFDRLRLPDVIGQPTLGEAAGDWFRDIVRAIFGSLDHRNIRMVPGVFILVPKKNSKTTNGAGLMLTALLMNVRPHARFALFGPTQEIADIAFAAVSGMIAADTGLKKLLHVQDHLKQVTHRLYKSTLKVTTFDPAVATGGKYAGWLLDEAHLLGKVSYAARVIGQIRGARTAVPESFGVIITTQSDEPPAGVFKQELQYARDVRDGKIEAPTVLPVLYEFPEEVQADKEKPWRNPELWPLVLPNVGRSVNVDVLVQDYATARDKGDDEERRWASQHLNIEIGIALHADGWPGAKYWQQQGAPRITLAHIIATSDVCTVGVDGGGLDDLLGLCVIGRHRETKIWQAWFHAWADEGVLTLRKDIAPMLRDLASQGDLTIVDLAGAAEIGDGESPDVAGVRDIVEQLFDAGLLPEKAAIGLDAVGVAAIVDAIASIGVPDGCMVAVPQGYRLSGVIKGMARKLKDGSFVHGGQALMDFCVGNAKQESRGNAVLITKQVSGSAKIDPLLAGFNAFDLMSRNPEASGGPSVYETRAPMVIEGFSVV